MTIYHYSCDCGNKWDSPNNNEKCPIVTPIHYGQIMGPDGSIGFCQLSWTVENVAQ